VTIPPGQFPHDQQIRRALQRVSSRLTLACILVLAGCGYQQAGRYDQPMQSNYKWHSLYREDIQSIAVPIFGNRTYTRGIEFRLSEAVIKQMEERTPWKVISRDRADTILEGEITEASFLPLSHDYNTNLPQEQLLTITVKFVWKDLRNGQILGEEKSLSQSATYYPTLGEGSFVGQQLAIEKLALAVVQRLEAQW